MSESPLKVLVVDDSVFFRKVLSEILAEIEGVVVIGSASSGGIALKKSQALKPDVVTVDVEMPGMDGLELLQHLQETLPDTIVIMISSVTKRGAKCTVKALENGALDFIEKPSLDDPEENIKYLLSQLKRIMSVVSNKKLMAVGAAGTDRRGKIREASNKESTAKQKESTEDILKRIKSQQRNKIDLIVIGISTGGPAALPVLFKNLSTKINLPILIVQHMPPVFVRELVDSLNRKTEFDVVVGESYQELKPNRIYIAPGGAQMKLAKLPEANSPCILITDDEAENFCKPSIDYLFRSVGKYYGDKTLALIMTGMGRDGVLGLKELKAQNATVYAQDEESSVVFGMAMEAVKAEVVDEIIPLPLLAQAIEERVSVHSVKKEKTL